MNISQETMSELRSNLVQLKKERIISASSGLSCLTEYISNKQVISQILEEYKDKDVRELIERIKVYLKTSNEHNLERLENHPISNHAFKLHLQEYVDGATDSESIAEFAEIAIPAVKGSQTTKEVEAYFKLRQRQKQMGEGGDN